MVSIWLTPVNGVAKKGTKTQYEKDRPRKARPIFFKLEGFGGLLAILLNAGGAKPR
jgi:hypothetical protein